MENNELKKRITITSDGFIDRVTLAKRTADIVKRLEDWRESANYWMDAFYLEHDKCKRLRKKNRILKLKLNQLIETHGEGLGE